MKMNEEIYANAGVTLNNRADSSDGDKSYDIYLSEGSLETQRARSHMQSEASAPPEGILKRKQNGRDTRWSRCYRLTAVCVVLLCVLLLTAVTLLWIKYNNLNTKYNQLQTSNSKLTIERDQLQKERDGYLRTFCDLDEVRCFSFSSSLYFMSNEKKNWNESRQDCRDKGADLVIINSRDEQEFIAKILDNSDFWIGLTDGQKVREWKWVDGTPLTTAFWDDNEPNGDAGQEDCVEIYSYYKGNGWNDNKCSYRKSWICEKHLSQ